MHRIPIHHTCFARLLAQAPAPHLVRLVAHTLGIILLFSQLSLGQEFRSTTTIQSASQPVTVDLSNVAAFDRASLTLHNSAGTPVSSPQVSNINTPLPLSRAAILSQLPDTGTDEGNAIQAWRFVVSHRFHLCSSGTRQDGVLRDPLRFFGAYGFGC